MASDFLFFFLSHHFYLNGRPFFASFLIQHTWTFFVLFRAFLLLVLSDRREGATAVLAHSPLRHCELHHKNFFFIFPVSLSSLFFFCLVQLVEAPSAVNLNLTHTYTPTLCMPLSRLLSFKNMSGCPPLENKKRGEGGVGKRHRSRVAHSGSAPPVLSRFAASSSQRGRKKACLVSFSFFHSRGSRQARSSRALVLVVARLSLRSIVVPGALSIAKFLMPCDGQVVD